jgi:hypothetical protein
MRDGGRETGIWDQFGGHGETGAAGMEVDGGNFDPTPFCDTVTPVKAVGNDGRGEMCDVGSFEGDILKDDGPPILQRMTNQYTSVNRRRHQTNI